MKKNKKNKKELKNVFNSYKTIIILSLLLNIILLGITYLAISNNKTYSFSGKDDYIEINDGLISLSTDINILNGSNIKYIKSEDVDVKDFKIGYYVMNNNKLVEIVTTSYNGETEMKLSELVNNFTNINVVEKNNNKVHFTSKNKSLIGDGLYIVIEAKTTNGDTIFDKLKLNITKISKY